MFEKIEAALVKVLQEGLEEVSKSNVVAKKRRLDKLPAVCVGNVGFEFVDIGVGRSMGSADNRRHEAFSGDGETVNFTLKEKALRPLISVEHPTGVRLFEDDYAVDYGAGIVTFKRPPAEGEDNVTVRFYLPFEVKGLRLNLRYHVNVWGKDEAQRDALTEGAVAALLREERYLSEEGVHLKPVRGFNVDPEDPKEGFGKTIEYDIETEMLVEVTMPRMEEIDIKWPDRGP
ncbi:MAG TPA: hypothetical protein VM050_01385 [Patescibacteria group bacterium]|nr:hypothetical protein [Patescibacteria group bacterium]